MKTRITSFWKSLHKRARHRLKFHQYKQRASREEERDVVKGTARRVIVVKSPDPMVFEEAIFVVRDDYLRKPGVSQKDLVRQARQTAKNYTQNIGTKRRPWFRFRSPAPYIAAAGAAVTKLAYVVLHMAGIY